VGSTLFDRYIAVDWSANNKPKLGKDSIWAGIASSRDDRVEALNLSTRGQAEAWLHRQLVETVRAGGRVLVGLDFPCGYPTGFAAALGVGNSWRGVWHYLAEQVQDDERNRSNRFGVAAKINRLLGADAPFWGRPSTQPDAHLPATKAVTYGHLSEWRRAELALHAAGLHPHSVWKLAYPGSVGSQALLGIPVLHRLRWKAELRDVSLIWPFEVTVPSFPAGTPGVVHVEVWPSAAPFDNEAGICRDERQVRAVVRQWQDQDRRGTLAGAFAGVPIDEDIRREEGWILGIGSPGYGARIRGPRRDGPVRPGSLRE
jgi:precorrin-8X/cobalt-precorrin-8 methylmutase